MGFLLLFLGKFIPVLNIGNKQKQNCYELDLFLDTPRVHFFKLDETTAEIYATIFKQLKTKGKPIPTNDIWISATAIQYGLALLTLDKHFENIDGLLQHVS